MGDAYLGLVQAAKDFQPEQGVQFFTYARHRIRGAIWDGYRTRTGRRRFDGSFIPDPVGPYPERFDPPSTDRPYGYLEDAELRRALVAAIGKLDDRERLVVTLHYFEGVPFRQIGELFGVTESRVSQLDRQATERLARILHPHIFT